VDSVFHDWIATVDEQTAGGSPFAYARGTSPHHLLHIRALLVETMARPGAAFLARGAV
jgi:hypothetical protein